LHAQVQTLLDAFCSEFVDFSFHITHQKSVTTKLHWFTKLVERRVGLFDKSCTCVRIFYMWFVQRLRMCNNVFCSSSILINSEYFFRRTDNDLFSSTETVTFSNKHRVKAVIVESSRVDDLFNINPL
jgi:hypothetical protein